MNLNIHFFLVFLIGNIVTYIIHFSTILLDVNLIEQH